MKKVLLHVCCAPCGGQVIKDLQDMGYKVSVLFYNPNIYPQSEYDLRKKESENFCKSSDIPFFEIKEDPQIWLRSTYDLKDEKEGGKRCLLCYRLRLQKTADFAQEKKFNAFASTLAISPHKDSLKINTLGNEISQKKNIEFIDKDWKKDDGFKKSCHLARQHNFYRQNYCGCCYSIRKS